MDRFDRIYQLHHLLAGARVPVSRQRIEQELECSRATAKRIIEAMRLYLGAPIEYDRERNGYHYTAHAAESFELPGLWFNGSELQALLLMQQLLHQVQPGLLDPQLDPIRKRIDELLKQRHLEGSDIGTRIRLLSSGARAPGEHFARIAAALIGGRRLTIRYHSRTRDQHSEREVSPQRLTRYRDNWYLEAWCHIREATRIFAVDRIEITALSGQAAHRLSAREMENGFAASYGIFPGKAAQTAVLAFSPKRARWIANEQWHPQQQSRWREDGRFELSLPYGDPTELIMDILRYGPDVEVIAPPELRQAVQQRLRAALAVYP